MISWTIKSDYRIKEITTHTRAGTTNTFQVQKRFLSFFWRNCWYFDHRKCMNLLDFKTKQEAQDYIEKRVREELRNEIIYKTVKYHDPES